MENENAKKEGFSLKNLLLYVVVGAILFSVGSCFFGGDEESGGTHDDGGTDFRSDTWYEYTELPTVKMKNCLVTNAVVNQNSGRVVVTYYAYCFECEETYDQNLVYLSSAEPSFSRIHKCDCGSTVYAQLKLS